MRTEAADSHMNWWELGKEGGREGKKGIERGSGEGLVSCVCGGVLVERNEGDLETYDEEAVSARVKRKLALIAK